jgi:hypothetical protein
MKLPLVAALLLPSAAFAAPAFRHHFDTPQLVEAIAEIDMASPGADWARRGREAGVAKVTLDGGTPQHVILYGGSERFTYRVFLGRLQPGQHDLIIARDGEHSAAGAEVDVLDVKIQSVPASDPKYTSLSHMPVLYARANTIGRFSDVPLLAYCEPLTVEGRRALQYTVIFSNEDGGTSTRALMARWGRTTDIEYVYRVYFKPDGSVDRRTVQGPGHKEIDFKGAYEADHPLMMPVTNNNMIGEASESSLRFQLAPVLVSGLNDRGSREVVMDDHPVLYEVMSKELEREGKLRSFGASSGENISDPKNYLYVEFKANHRNSAFNVMVTLRDGRVFSSDLGRIDYAIERDGWARAAIELPPGSGTVDMASVAFQCIVPPPSEKGGIMAHSGRCELERTGRLFFLPDAGRPGSGWFRVMKPVAVATGQAIMLTKP